MNLADYIRERCARRGILLMTHAVVGYPSLEANRRMLDAMIEADVDLVELQLPFSEPVADGPLFVKANLDALAGGASHGQYWDLFSETTARAPFPVLAMCYYNSAFRMGHAAFCERLRGSGGRGFIIPDLPREEYGDLEALSAENGLAAIQFFTPTSTDERMLRLAQGARGFVYCVARRGVTGSATELDRGLYDLLARYRRMTDLPLALGFGIASADDIRRLRGVVDIAIVGSALLRSWERGGEDAYRAHLTEMAQARYS